MDLSQLHIKAMLSGFLIYILFSLMLNGILAVMLLPSADAGLTGDERVAAAAGNNLYMFLSLIISLLSLSAGAYVTSLISGEEAVLNALSLGIFVLVLHILTIILLAYPVWYDALSVLFMLPAAALGFWVSRRY